MFDFSIFSLMFIILSDSPKSTISFSLYIYTYKYVCIYHQFVLLGQISLTLSLRPFVPIIYRSWQVFQTTTFVRIELLQVGSCWSANTGTSNWRGPLENVTSLIWIVLEMRGMWLYSCCLEVTPHEIYIYIL